MLTLSQLDAEALQVTFDPEKVSYSTLIQFLYKTHDPTTKNKQGNDEGSQYRSAIFYHSPEQEAEAKTITEKVQQQWWKQGKISTEILPAGEWWDAETYVRSVVTEWEYRLMSYRYHQKYLDHNPMGYQCSTQ